MMTIASSLTIRSARPDEDALIAKHFYHMWLDNRVPPDAIESNWQEIVVNFIEQARREQHYQAFLAIVADHPVGSAGCQLFSGLYPNVIKADYRRQGYIWGVYVEPDYRQQGIGRQLTEQTVAYLRSIGCTRAVLNASPFGQPIYAQLGFVPGNVMQLSLES